jgi:cobalt-zinc-cadmium efflux system protein
VENKCGAESTGKLKLAIILTSAILVVEVVGGIISNSLALFSDASHVLMDVLALGLTLSAVRIASRPSSEAATFGHHRVEIFAALINGLLLLLVAVFILREAWFRLSSPPEIRTYEMLVFATTGLLVNVFITMILRGHNDLNIRGAYLHVLGDTLSSFAVIAGGIIIMLTGNHIVDPVLSIAIVGVILLGSARLLKESIDVLMERTPRHIDVEELNREILEVKGVVGIHDLHVWSICSNVHAMGAHIIVHEMTVKETEKLTSEIKMRLSTRFQISHTTLQFECTACETSDTERLRERKDLIGIE